MVLLGAQTSQDGVDLPEYILGLVEQYCNRHPLEDEGEDAGADIPVLQWRVNMFNVDNVAVLTMVTDRLRMYAGNIAEMEVWFPQVGITLDPGLQEK